MVYYAIPQKFRLRYVLKKELLIDPCLDIVGNRLPNYFVDRGGQDSESARQGVAALLGDLGSNEGLLIYPEGTRFSEEKRTALAHRYAESADMQKQLARWQRLLPPRLGGALAVLKANPQRDLIFCAHSGFEGSSHFSTLINGSWINARIKIEFWRIPYPEVPTEEKAQTLFLFDQWDRMERTVSVLQRTTGPECK
jgi:1-acyl-sn-glycerol-3-phosphate acyltransferase